jgi:hypothetical protein
MVQRPWRGGDEMVLAEDALGVLVDAASGEELEGGLGGGERRRRVCQARRVGSSRRSQMAERACSTVRA